MLPFLGIETVPTATLMEVIQTLYRCAGTKKAPLMRRGLIDGL